VPASPTSVYAEFDPLRRVAVCPPHHFALREPINVIQAEHLAAGRNVDQAAAEAEHRALVAALRAAGSDVLELPADPRFAYQINTRDVGFAAAAGFVVGRFRLPQRQGEELIASAALEASGSPLLGSIEGAALEGGDVVAIDRSHLAVGLGPRTEPAALAQLASLLGPAVELLPVHFADRFLHLDMIFNVIAERLALACLAALPTDFIERCRALGLRPLGVGPEEALGHGCNVLAVGGGRILSHDANGRVNELLRAEGLTVEGLSLEQLRRSGGGPRCLTLPLSREAA
jgi:N-dimethylarginine dimethylaminohydrolase